MDKLDLEKHIEDVKKSEGVAVLGIINQLTLSMAFKMNEIIDHINNSRD